MPLLRAQLLTVEGECRQALELFAANIGDADTQGLGRLLVSFLAESAWCKFKLGMIDAAKIDVERSVFASQVDCDPDDLAADHAALSMILEALGEPDRSKRVGKRSKDALIAHRAVQSDLLEEPLVAIPGRTRADT